MLVSTMSLNMLPVLATGLMGIQTFSSSSLMGKSAVLTYEDVFGEPFKNEILNVSPEPVSDDEEEKDYNFNLNSGSSSSLTGLNLASVAGSVLKTVAKYKYLKLALIIGAIVSVYKLSKNEKGGAF